MDFNGLLVVAARLACQLIELLGSLGLLCLLEGVLGFSALLEAHARRSGEVGGSRITSSK